MQFSRATVQALVDSPPSTEEETFKKILFVLASLQSHRMDDPVKPDLKNLASATGYIVFFKHSVFLRAVNDLLKQNLVCVGSLNSEGDATFQITATGLAAAEYEPCTSNQEYWVLLKALIWYAIPDSNDSNDDDTVDAEEEEEAAAEVVALDSDEDGDEEDENDENGRRVLRRLN